MSDPTPESPKLPELSTKEAVCLALPVGLGMVLFAIGFALALGYVVALIAARVAGSDVQPPRPAPLTVGVGVGALVFGLGLGLLARWARLGAVALGLVFLGLHVVALLGQGTPIVGGALLGIVAFGLLHPQVGAWFEPESAARRPEAGLKAYRAATAWLALIGIAFLFVVPAFNMMFQETGIHLPWMTEVMLSIARFVATPGELLPLLVLAPIPLLRLDEDRAKAATWTAHVVGGLLFVLTVAALLHPLWILIEKL